jgi:hypothetical protein
MLKNIYKIHFRVFNKDYNKLLTYKVQKPAKKCYKLNFCKIMKRNKKNSKKKN